MPSHHTPITCSNCGKSDEGTGSMGMCVKCHHAAAYAAKRTERLAQMAAHYPTVRDKKLAYQKQYAAAHVEGVRANQRKQYLANREGRIASATAWTKAHPETWRERNHQRRARVRAAFVERVSFAGIYKRDSGICQICHRPVSRAEGSLDHILPLVAGGLHETRNVRLTHRSCNKSRQHRGAAQLRLLG